MWGAGSYLSQRRMELLYFSCTMFFNSLTLHWYESFTENFLDFVDGKAGITDFRLVTD